VSQLDSYVDPLEPSADLDENRTPIYVVHADLEQPADLDRIVDVTLARHGRVDLLVNNAAYAGIHRRGLVDGQESLLDLDRHFRMNVGVPLELAVRFAQAFWRNRDLENREQNRNIVNVSSLSGSQVFPFVGQAVYAASKAALNQLTRHLAAEFGTFGVRVNGLAPNNFPGIVSTERVAGAITRLDHESVTGRILTVDAPAPVQPAAAP
jgi:NAD(P)-dependent dehydrogenase (short-subunit alcohol dehydrogenase family)